MSQEGERKRSIDEVSRGSEMTSKLGDWSLPHERFGGSLSCCPNDVRHRDGASLISGAGGERGNLSSRCSDGCRRKDNHCEKRNLRAAETARTKVLMRGTRTDHLVVVMRPGNAGGAKRMDHPGVDSGQPPQGGMKR